MPASGVPPLDVAVLRSPGTVVLRVGGELDIATAGQLDEALRSALRGRPESLLVDLRGLSFVDPSGARPLRVLVGKQPSPTRLRIRAAGGVRRVLELVGLASLLEA